MRPSELGPERWRRIDAVFDAALDTPPGELAAFLSDACADDEDLRAEVEALLEAHAQAQESFEPPVGPAGGELQPAGRPLRSRGQVGPFRLLREIGRGGMGVVYLAEDTRLGRRVALKVLPPYLGLGPEAHRRFVAEARAVSALDHPNIATLYEIDVTDEGQPYMVFAYYEGDTLEARIAEGPLPSDEAVSIALRIADGLAVAHRSGIVHRDVKPSNVLLTEGGDVKLLDFGVAKVAGEDLTGADIRVGTVAYMSPEQAEGRALDGRTDLWSLGVVLFEMLTGERPFRGDDRASLLRSIPSDEPEWPGSSRSDLPEAVARVVEKLLSKEPGGRHRSAEDLCADLGSLQSGRPGEAVVESLPWERRGGSSARRKYGTWGRVRVWAPVVAVALASLGGAAWLASRAVGTGGRIERLAVLPLANLTGDAGQQYFVDGVHDELIAELGKLGTVSVISRTSVMRYRNTELSIPEIARQLGVDALVEGSVLRQGDSLEITTRLIAASPERELWAETYRRGVGSVFQIGSQVATSVADEIQVELTPKVKGRLAAARPVNPAAYDAFTLGRFNLERRDREGFELARKYLRRSLQVDPSFAPSYAALGESYGSAAFFGLAAPVQNMPKARALAESALAIDSTLPKAHALLAAVHLYWDRDWAAAEREARRAVALNPSDPTAHRVLSEALSVAGRYTEALAEVERGSELDKFVPFSAFRPAIVLGYMRHYDEAIARTRSGLKFFTDFWQGHWLLCQFLGAEKRFAEAIPECEEAVKLSLRSSMALSLLAGVDAASGRAETAKRLLAELQERARTSYVGASNIAAVYVALGDRDHAFEWLNRAYTERDVAMVHLRDAAVWDPLRSDPRFGTLLREMGLEPGSRAS